MKGRLLKVRRLRGGVMGRGFGGRIKDHAREKVVINTPAPRSATATAIDWDRPRKSKDTWEGKERVYDIVYTNMYMYNITVSLFVGEGIIQCTVGGGWICIYHAVGRIARTPGREGRECTCTYTVGWVLIASIY